ncbi:hypothetical protein TYRP_002249 [Tyrophagus putrescentiae]|nr:hypothetical protein TYRP_002249 [Tyrophagus putrescentiae]
MEKWRKGEGIGIGGGGRQQKERPIAHEAAGALDNDASSRQNMATDSSSSKEEDRDADVGHELPSLLLPPGRKLQFITSSLVAPPPSSSSSSSASVQAESLICKHFVPNLSRILLISTFKVGFKSNKIRSHKRP